MRNLLIARDAVAQEAGAQILAAGGNAADAVIAAMLAGATRATPAALLGSGVILLAGAGVGEYVVDGRARAPGLGEPRPTAPVSPPLAWRAAVPGLLEGVLAAHNRFGVLPLGAITRTAASAVREAESSVQVRARVRVLEAFARTGLSALERLGVLQAIMEVAGPVAGGVITRDDLAPFVPPVRPLEVRPAGEHEVLVMPPDPLPRHVPPPLPPVPVDVALCADMHGVVACAVWALAPEAVALPGETGLSLAALSSAPTKGVTRRRPGSALEMPVPVAIVRHRGRAWAAAGAAGEGDLEGARDAFLRARLEAAGIPYPAAAREVGHARGVLLWVMRDEGGEVHGISEALDR